MKSDMSDFWARLGLAMVILALCLGIGGCEYLIDKGMALREQPQAPPVSQVVTNQ